MEIFPSKGKDLGRKLVLKFNNYHYFSDVYVFPLWRGIKGEDNFNSKKSTF